MINERLVRKYCRDELSKIENYDKAIADTNTTWHLHHRLELTLDGEPALTTEQLKMHDMYYNRPYYELIFLTPSEHHRLHVEGQHPSDETRRKISESLKGKHLSDETRRKMSEAKKNMSEETRRKMSESRKGRTFTEEWRIKLSEAQQGKKLGPMSEEHRKKMSEALKGKKLGPMSEEHRKKMSEAAKRRWARKRELLSHRELA